MPGESVSEGGGRRSLRAVNTQIKGPRDSIEEKWKLGVARTAREVKVQAHL